MAKKWFKLNLERKRTHQKQGAPHQRDKWVQVGRQRSLQVHRGTPRQEGHRAAQGYPHQCCQDINVKQIDQQVSFFLFLLKFHCFNFPNY